MVAPSDSDLSPGIEAPQTGTYVVVHSNPSHAPAHEVLIVARTILPECNECAHVRFSFKGATPIVIEDHEFFKPLFTGAGTFPAPGRR
jgi:hypothetical protein